MADKTSITVPPPFVTDEITEDPTLIATRGMEVERQSSGPNLVLRIAGVNQDYRFLLSPPAVAQLSLSFRSAFAQLSGMLDEAVQRYLYGKNQS